MLDVTSSYGTPFDFIACFDIIEEPSCLKNCIFTKLSQIVLLMYTNMTIVRHIRSLFSDKCVFRYDEFGRLHTPCFICISVYVRPANIS